ncbi:MAG: hypothetical protein JXB29_11820 [Sedimentisphaerales bacterium]|nr:hypothetical protein [Sedimentisphaerales bacterium]
MFYSHNLLIALFCNVRTGKAIYIRSSRVMTLPMVVILAYNSNSYYTREALTVIEIPLGQPQLSVKKG